MRVELMSSKYAHYSPTGGQRMLRDLKNVSKVAKMALVRKTSKVGANSALNGLSGLSEFSWSGLLEKAASGLVQNRISEMQADKASADSRLAQAESDARSAAQDATSQKNAILAADAAAARSLGARQPGFFSQPKNIILVGGGLAAIVIGALVLRKKKAI